LQRVLGSVQQHSYTMNRWTLW